MPAPKTSIKKSAAGIKKAVAGFKYQILTFGCQMNYSDSERVAAILEKSGYRPTAEIGETDLFIFNTCSIRQKGEDRVLGTLRNVAALKKANPRLLIGMTGCMVRKTGSRNSKWQDKDELLQKLKELDFVFNIRETHRLPEVLLEAEPQLELPNLEETGLNDYLKIQPQYTSPFQAFVPIQIGCDKYCTYCIVPYSRGREQSRPLQEIVDECRKLVENGCKEITLVGQTVNSYGLSALDKKSGLFDYYHSVKSGARPELPFIRLLRAVNALGELGLSRLRYSSPHPKDFGDQLIEAHATLRTLCPHLHLPLQAGDNEILARMNRKYTIEEYSDKIRKFRGAVPGAAVTTDVIVGFCGETPEQFENTLKAFREIRWDQAYISRYSQRSGTVAANCFTDDVTNEEKARRWHQVNNLLKVISLEKNREYLGRTLEILVERYITESGECEGRSRENKVVQFAGNSDGIGQLIQVEITAALPWVLKGRITAL
jgi:tRNA-2-methylthio-N6-dimethylallyladenosine synthase